MFYQLDGIIKIEGFGFYNINWMKNHMNFFLFLRCLTKHWLVQDLYVLGVMWWLCVICVIYMDRDNSGTRYLVLFDP